MPTLTELETTGNRVQSPLDNEAVLPGLGRAGLAGLELSAGHFYGGDEERIGRVFGGELRVIVGKTDEKGGRSNEVVGNGRDVESALQDSLEKMRTLETVRTKSIATIEMTPGAAVSFTTLEHYSPKMAPSAETYTVPDYLKDMLTDSASGIDTYRNTTEKEGWQAELTQMVSDYLVNNPDGQQLAEGLKIRSLRHLNPEQAVKLSTAFVQNLSVYSDADVGRGNGETHADKSTAAELLREGLDKSGVREWEGNGVCRNIASNAKAVFESLKANQTDLSMLNNTYAVYGAGIEGAGYADSRPNPHSLKTGPKKGHAWNTFVTIDAKGSAVATITDATWALGKSKADMFKHLDRTEVRAAAQIMGLFEKSDVKEKALSGLAQYTQRLIMTTRIDQRLPQSGKQGIREYVVTEYLKAAGSLDTIPEAYDLLPSAIIDTAVRMSGDFEQSEIITLFALDKASGGDRQGQVKGVIAGFYKGGTRVRPGWQRAEDMVFADNELQELAYDAIGNESMGELADENGKFRARLRQMKPDALPAFDAAERPADADELGYLAQQAGIHDKRPEWIMRQVRMRLRQKAGDESIFNAVVAGRSDYDLVKSYRVISDAFGRTEGK